MKRPKVSPTIPTITSFLTFITSLFGFLLGKIGSFFPHLFNRVLIFGPPAGRESAGEFDALVRQIAAGHGDGCVRLNGPKRSPVSGGFFLKSTGWSNLGFHFCL